MNDQNPGVPPPAGGDPELTAPRECPDCRPGALDPYHCRAEGVKAEAEYDDAHQDGPRPDQYEQARLDYGKARHDAIPVVDEVRSQLAHVTDQLKCIIDDRETVECLDEAWLEVEERLKVCAHRVGCCCDDDDDFNTDVAECGIEIISARIAEYEHRTGEAEKCFAGLLKEPADLTDRVAKLKAKVAGIVSDVGGDTATTDFKRLYARALDAQRDLDEVWRGFPHAHDYADCVCRALRISLRGLAALACLTGELAVRKCRIAAREARCEHLCGHVVDAIIEEYVRKCQPRHEHDGDRDHRPAPGEDPGRRQVEDEERQLRWLKEDEALQQLRLQEDRDRQRLREAENRGD
jgi:hypothetical protein